MLLSDSFCSANDNSLLFKCKLPIFGSWEEKGNDLGIEVFKTRNSARWCLLLVVVYLLLNNLFAKFKYNFK